jgi:hypothetical protein
MGRRMRSVFPMDESRIHQQGELQVNCSRQLATIFFSALTAVFISNSFRAIMSVRTVL